MPCDPNTRSAKTVWKCSFWNQCFAWRVNFTCLLERRLKLFSQSQNVFVIILCHSVRFVFCGGVTQGHMKFESESGFWRVSERIGVAGWAEIFRVHNQNAGPPSSACWASQFQKFWKKGVGSVMRCWRTPHDISVISAQNTSSMLKVNKNVGATSHLSSSSCQSTETAPNNRRIKIDAPNLAKTRPLTCANFFCKFSYASISSLFNVCSPYAHEKKRTPAAQVWTPYPHKRLAKTFETSKLLIEVSAKKPTSKDQLIMFPNNPRALERTLITARMLQSRCH